jgi:hypothetical protein
LGSEKVVGRASPARFAVPVAAVPVAVAAVAAVAAVPAAALLACFACHRVPARLLTCLPACLPAFQLATRPTQTQTYKRGWQSPRTVLLSSSSSSPVSSPSPASRAPPAQQPGSAVSVSLATPRPLRSTPPSHSHRRRSPLALVLAPRPRRPHSHRRRTQHPVQIQSIACPRPPHPLRRHRLTWTHHVPQRTSSIPIRPYVSSRSPD